MSCPLKHHQQHQQWRGIGFGMLRTKSVRTTTPFYRSDNNIICLQSEQTTTSGGDDMPSDYDDDSLVPEEKVASSSSESMEDAMIRDDLKRELFLLASVTNRGMHCTEDERNVLIDLVTQLEALNPTADPAKNCQGEWDLCLSNVVPWRSSPFFLSVQAALSQFDDSGSIARNGFDIHDSATTASRIGRVRQQITMPSSSQNNALILTSEVDLNVGIAPGLPLGLAGTVRTNATVHVRSSDTWQMKILTSSIGQSNVPLIGEWIERAFVLDVRQLYKTVFGLLSFRSDDDGKDEDGDDVPEVILKTFYVDEAIRITRDVDDNFYVFSRV